MGLSGNFLVYHLMIEKGRGDGRHGGDEIMQELHLYRLMHLQKHSTQNLLLNQASWLGTL